MNIGIFLILLILGIYFYIKYTLNKERIFLILSLMCIFGIINKMDLIYIDNFAVNNIVMIFKIILLLIIGYQIYKPNLNYRNNRMYLIVYLGYLIDFINNIDNSNIVIGKFSNYIYLLNTIIGLIMGYQVYKAIKIMGGAK